MSMVETPTPVKKRRIQEPHLWFDDSYHRDFGQEGGWTKIALPAGRLQVVRTGSKQFRVASGSIDERSSQRIHRRRRKEVPLDQSSPDKSSAGNPGERSAISLDRLSEHPKFDEILGEAADEGYPEPSSVALRNALRFYDLVPGDLPQKPNIYARFDGDVTVDVRNGAGNYVKLLCQADGKVLNMFNLDNYIEYPDVNSAVNQVLVCMLDALKNWDV